jgi:hypothetical protein
MATPLSASRLIISCLDVSRQDGKNRAPRCEQEALKLSATTWLPSTADPRTPPRGSSGSFRGVLSQTHQIEEVLGDIGPRHVVDLAEFERISLGNRKKLVAQARRLQRGSTTSLPRLTHCQRGCWET